MRTVYVVLAICALVPPAARAQQKPKDLQWTHAFDLSCRPYGTDTFDKATKFGVEVFRDNNNGFGLYISHPGAIAVAAGGFETLKVPLTSKGPDWTTGLDLPAREAGAKEFKKDTKVHAMEVFRDPNVGQWMYITEKGNLGVARSTGAALATNKAPKWVHSVDLNVRKGGERAWAGALKYGIEVYRDGNTGNLVYICQTGAVAVIPEAGETKAGKAPEWLHGLDLACRKHDQPNFDKNTRKFGVEIFRDENNGNLIYITETGSIAVTAGAAAFKAPTPKVKEPQWSHGLNVKCRGVGEKEFSEKTRTFGIEVFRDDNLAATIYINELGNLAAVRK
jgi:hypothetical protein